jgi:hypothetical protein
VQHVEVSTPLWRVFAVICTAAALAYYLNAVHHADGMSASWPTDPVLRDHHYRRGSSSCFQYSHSPANASSDPSRGVM